jgi:zinc/manganese transport system substrate-binding protein
MKNWKLILAAAGALLAGSASPAAAKVTVVAANQDLAWVVRTIGGPAVTVDYLARSTEDPHAVEPRPSQVARLTRADAVVRIGMDLDLWFDSLIRASANPRIQAGGRGHIDASRGIRALEIPSGKLDPSRGDIHVHGNPHYFYGPSNLSVVADTVRDGLKRLEPAAGAAFDANYAALTVRLAEALKGWRAKLAGARGKSVVTYHKSLVYFLSEFGLREFDNVEPKPGLEPTPGHVSGVGRRMKAEGVRVILTESWRSRRFADLLARQAGGSVVVLPGGIGAERGLDDYFTFMGAWVDRVAAALA